VHLVLIPGLLCDPDLWSHQTSHLADIAQITVADITAGETIEALAAQVLAEAPDKFALAGLSMGGYVAQVIMRLAPERVERLALLDPSGRADTDDQRMRRSQLIDMSRIGKFRGVTDRLLPILIHEDRLADEDLTDRVKAMAERVAPEAFHRQQMAIMSRPDGRSDFAGYNIGAGGVWPSGCAHAGRVTRRDGGFDPGRKTGSYRRQRSPFFDGTPAGGHCAVATMAALRMIYW
jgi:pimeloyl-ACP methyl ester carboxylesterase